MRMDWTFDAGADGFRYADDGFRFTKQPRYARGEHAMDEGQEPGALKVSLGGIDGRDVTGMSGGWTRTFTLEEAGAVTLSFQVKMTMTGDYERDEYADALLSVDGQRIGFGGRDHLLRLRGDGDGGPDVSTGWKTVTVNLGTLSAGQHTLKFGGYNNKKTDANESTKLLFDNVSIRSSDDTGGEPIPIPTPTPTPTPVPPTPTPPPGTADLEAFEARVFELTNAFRVQNGRAALENDARLNDAAEGWSQAMAQGDFFRHSTPAQTEAEGYAWRAWGENIAVGQQTPEAVVNGWINSPGHRANMLGANFRDIGIGHVYLEEDGGNLRYKHDWTQVFGTERGDDFLV